MKRLKTGMAEIILLVIGLVIIIGSLTFFSACGAKEDGSFMNCHWAQVIITSLGALISAEALAAVIVPNRMFRSGLDLAACLTSIIIALVPGTLISLCMMPDMHCRTVTQPVTLLFASAAFVAAVTGLILNIRRKEK